MKETEIIFDQQIQELLKPRYKVIGDYPSSDYEVGLVIHFPEKENWFTKDLEWVTEPIRGKNGGISQRSIKYFEEYPNLFKLLEWWEERDIKDMPEYVKFNEDRMSTTFLDGVEEPEFHKVKRHWAESLDTHWRYSSYKHFISEWHNVAYNYSAFLPSTEYEYNDYNKTYNESNHRSK